MTLQRQREVLAELDGLKICWPHDDEAVTDEVTDPMSYPYRIVRRRYFRCRKCKRTRGDLVTDEFPRGVPNYLSDWNPLHALVNKMPINMRETFLVKLDIVTGRRSEDWLPARIATSTQAEWAEAILRTYNRWEEDTNPPTPSVNR